MRKGGGAAEAVATLQPHREYYVSRPCAVEQIVSPQSLGWLDIVAEVGPAYQRRPVAVSVSAGIG